MLSYSRMFILLAILVSSLTKICHLHNIFLLFLNHIFYNQLKRIDFNLSWTLLLVLSPTGLNVSHYSYSRITPLAQYKWENKYKVISLVNKWLKTGQSSYLRSLLSLPSHRFTRSSSLVTLTRPSLTPRLKIANRSFYHSALGLGNSLPSDIRHLAHHVTPSPILNSPVSYLSTSLFL